MSLKNPLTPAGIEPATFLFVAQHLNHCATARNERDDQYIGSLQIFHSPFSAARCTEQAQRL